MIPNDWFYATVELTVIAVVSHGFTFWTFWRSASIPVLFRLFDSRDSDQSLVFEFCLGKVS